MGMTMEKRKNEGVFFGIAIAKKGRKAEVLHDRFRPQTSNDRTEPKADQKTAEGPTNVGLRRVLYGEKSASSYINTALLRNARRRMEGRLVVCA